MVMVVVVVGGEVTDAGEIGDEVGEVGSSVVMTRGEGPASVTARGGEWRGGNPASGAGVAVPFSASPACSA